MGSERGRPVSARYLRFYQQSFEIALAFDGRVGRGTARSRALCLSGHPKERLRSLLRGATPSERQEGCFEQWMERLERSLGTQHHHPSLAASGAAGGAADVLGRAPQQLLLSLARRRAPSSATTTAKPVAGMGKWEAGDHEKVEQEEGGSSWREFWGITY